MTCLTGRGAPHARSPNLERPCQPLGIPRVKHADKHAPLPVSYTTEPYHASYRGARGLYTAVYPARRLVETSQTGNARSLARSPANAASQSLPTQPSTRSAPPACKIPHTCRGQSHREGCRQGGLFRLHERRVIYTHSHRSYQAGDKECREPVVISQVVGEPAY